MGRAQGRLFEQVKFSAIWKTALPPELPPRSEAYEVRVGDVLMSRASGSPELVGSTALVKATRERLMLSDKIWTQVERVRQRSFFRCGTQLAPIADSDRERSPSGGNGMA